MPDLTGLALFARVAEERSFAGAARALGVSVATVSRGVAQLEGRLGARLLNRTSRRLALTELGRTLAEGASRLVQDAEAMEASVRDLAATPRGLVRLAAPMAFGVRCVAPLLPAFFRACPDVSIDLHLSDEAVDLIGQGFDAALRIAVLPDSSLLARKLCPMARFILASPAYLVRHGRPAHPRELRADHCLGYAYRARADVWRLTGPRGEVHTVRPAGPLRVTNVEAVLPMALAGAAVVELPEFLASEFLADGRLEPLLPAWSMAPGGLHFVVPSARARPAKTEAVASFFAEHLARPAWAWPPPRPARRGRRA